MAINKTDKSFKTLINKRFTTPDRYFFQEIGKDTINTHMREVWMNTIPEDSASAISSGYARYHKQYILTPDPTFITQAFYFISGSGFTPGTSTINSGWLINEASQSYFINNFIGDKYGSSYEVKLYDYNNNQIFKTDTINWIFDYATGVLHIADPGAYVTPYKVTVFKYSGLTLADPGAVSGSTGFWTGSFVDGHIERQSDVIISGSLTVTKSLDVTGDVDINGGLNIDQSQYGNAIQIDTDRYIHFNGGATNGWIVTQTTSPANSLVFSYNEFVAAGIGYFYVDAATEDKTIVVIRTGSLVVNNTTLGYNPSNVFEVYGDSYMGGNIDVPALATVDGVDISEFSSSVATQINNLETGSSQWTLNDDGTISRDSDVKISGSLYLSGSDNRLYGTSSQAVSASSALWAITASYAENAGGSAGLWTGSFSDGHIERVSDVQITGSLYQLGNSASFQDYVEVNGFMHVNGGTW